VKILILCTGNSARSQMAEGFLRAYAPWVEVHSAGTVPAADLHPVAVEVMKEIGIDISRQRPKSVDLFVRQPFDFLITVCENARETCPVFAGDVGHRLHLGFGDPAAARGGPEEVRGVFRQIRDTMQIVFGEFSDRITGSRRAS